MCGIAGIISNNQKNLLHIKQMTDIIQHRGPDGWDAYVWNNVALGHRRLSIIDLTECGKQPMHYLDKYAIIHNGEVYNYIELRKELCMLGYSFKSHTDTEVMLAAYDYWGTHCLNRFNGMFAFAILDKEKNKLFCARDRFGIKPFYYYETKNYFAFASEIKQFTVLDGWEAVANKERLYDFLQSGLQDHTHETLFENVFQLKGGHFFVYDLKTNEKKIQQWYDVAKSNTIFNSKEPAEKTFKELFNSSVGLHLRADVKVSSCLSGGLDSSSIVLTVNEQLKQLNKETLQETVSSCFENKKYDEQQYIRTVVEKANCINHKVFPNLSDLYSQLDDIVWHQDEPFESTSIFAQWEVFKKAKQQNIAVMLDGQGADELLAGYHSYYGTYLWELIKKGKLKKFIAEFKSLKKLDLYSTFIWKEIIKNAMPLNAWLFIKKKGKKEKSWINYKYKKTLDVVDDTSFKSVQQKSYSQLTASNLPKLLHWEDRDSMAFSIEARVPFLDYRLAEYIYNLPPDKKINNGITKSVLRDAMKDVLPQQVLNRKDKMGFVTPEELWLKEQANSIKQDLQKAVEISNRFINKHILDKFDNIINDKEKFDFTIWRVLCFAKWVEVFKVRI